MTFGRTMLATGILAVALGAGCANMQPTYGGIMKISDEHMHYRISKSEGEKMLIELAKTAKREDAWIYRMRDRQGEWIDIGKESEMGPFGGSVYWDMKYLDHILKKGDEITDYHIHPITEADPIIDIINERLHTPSPSDWRIESWLPSSCDFISNYNTKKRLTKKGIKMNPSRVISPRAISIYDCDTSEKLTEKFFNSLLKWHTKLSGRQGLDDLKRLKAELKKHKVYLETIILTDPNESENRLNY